MPNRVWTAPMGQYSSVRHDGMPGDWHLVHLGKHATGGFGMVMTETTAISPEGRITPEDTGLWSDDQIEPWHRITEFIRSQLVVPAIQLGHAGRRASTFSPFAGREGSIPLDEGGWETISSTHLPLEGLAKPRFLQTAEVAEIPAVFAAAAARADAAGFDVLDVHAAHGYLLHQFLSPLINNRRDKYGGSFVNRVRLTVEVAQAIRTVWPEHKPLLFRISGTDWTRGGWKLSDAARLGGLLAGCGVDLIDVAAGGALIKQQIPLSPGHQVPLADEVRRFSGLPVSAMGLISRPFQAELMVASGAADAIMVARAAVREPLWALRQAHQLEVPDEQIPYPPLRRVDRTA